MTANLSPKQRFLTQRETAKKHNELMASQVFTETSETALLQYQQQLMHNQGHNPGDMTAAAANFLRLSGAREYLAVLRNLGQDEKQPPKPIDMINLEQRPN